MKNWNFGFVWKGGPQADKLCNIWIYTDGWALAGVKSEKHSRTLLIHEIANIHPCKFTTLLIHDIARLIMSYNSQELLKVDNKFEGQATPKKYV